MKNPSWIIFDVSGVLTQFTFRRNTPYQIDGKQIDARILETVYDDPGYTPYMLGEIAHDVFISGFLKSQKITISVQQFDALFIHDLHPMPGMEELVRDLSAMFSIAVASNEGKVFSGYRIHASGVEPYISKKFISCDIKKLKPDPEFFRTMLGILHVKPRECLFIDDDKRNVYSATSIGMQGIVFTGAGSIAGLL